METFAAKLRNLRKSKKVSLRTLAMKAGISAPYLSDIENGKTKAPEAKLLSKLVLLLELSDMESYSLLELAALERNEIPIDIADAIKKNPSIKDLIRAGNIKGADDKTWKRLFGVLEKELKALQEIK